MVKAIAYEDNENFLLMTAGFMKGHDFLHWAGSTLDERLKQLVSDFPSLEAHVSWLSTAIMRDALLCEDDFYDQEDFVKSIPLETIVVGPGPNNVQPYRSWFDQVEGATTYRVVIHRSPKMHNETKVPIMCDAIYRGRACPIDCVYTGNAEQSIHGLHFLQDLARAYREGPEAVDAVIGKYDNPFWIYRDAEENSPVGDSELEGTVDILEITSEKIKIPQTVYDTLEHIRQSGETNMLDRLRVQQIADRLEAYETVLWIEDHPQLYARGIFQGFESEDD